VSTAICSSARRWLARSLLLLGGWAVSTAAPAVLVPFTDVVDPVSKPLLFGPASAPSDPFIYGHSILDDGFVPGRDVVVRVPPTGLQQFPRLVILLDDDPLGPGLSDPEPEQAIIVTDFDLLSPTLVPLATNATGTYVLTVDPSKLNDGLLSVLIDIVPDFFDTPSGPIANDLYFISSTLTLFANVQVPAPATLPALATGLLLVGLAGNRRLGRLRRR